MADTIEERLDALEKEANLMRNLAEALHQDLITRLPVGTVIPHATSVTPPGWLKCDGTEYSIDQYPALAEVLGQAFGKASKERHFKVPNLSGRVVVASGRATPDAPERQFAAAHGTDTLRLVPQQLPPHSHGLTPNVYSFAGSASAFLANKDNAVVAGFPYWDPQHDPNADRIVAQGHATRVTTAMAGSGAAVDPSQPSLVLSYIIKF